jgi:hypothetical protein
MAMTTSAPRSRSRFALPSASGPSAANRSVATLMGSVVVGVCGVVRPMMPTLMPLRSMMTVPSPGSHEGRRREFDS